MGMACTAPQGWFSGLAVLLRRCLAKFINRSKSENDNYATANSLISINHNVVLYPVQLY